MTSAHDASVAAGAVLQALSAGELSTTEAAGLMGLMETYRRTLELTELEKRIVALEAK